MNSGRRSMGAKFSFLMVGFIVFCALHPARPLWAQPATGDKAPDEVMSWIPVALHVATSISDGSLEMEDVAAAARATGIQAVVITDRDIMKWEYGLWPWRRLMRVRRESNSVFRYGIDRYLDRVEAVNRANQDILLIPGLESAPFYHWEGHPFLGNLKILDWHKHLLVMGLDGADEYSGLPLLSNRQAIKRTFRLADLLGLWPLLFLAAGIVCLRVREYHYKDTRGRALGNFSKRWRLFGVVLILMSLLFIFDHLPFSVFEYDQYHAEPEARPYQLLIDYVKEKGGAVFWAHPEAEYVDERDGVGIETKAHVDDLWKTSRYTGFAVFYEGYKTLGRPGGDWDHLLRAYCRREREAPVWVIGGLAFDYGTTQDLERRMRDVQTFVGSQRLEREDVLASLRQGRMYVSRGREEQKFFLKEFSVKDRGGQKKAAMGDEVHVKTRPVIRIQGFLGQEGALKRGDPGQPEGKPRMLNVRLIKNGELVRVFSVQAPVDIIYEDSELPVGKTYYRLEIENGRQLIVSNPVFVLKDLYLESQTG